MNDWHESFDVENVDDIPLAELVSLVVVCLLFFFLISTTKLF
jgi:hypothetical protein